MSRHAIEGEVGAQAYDLKALRVKAFKQYFAVFFAGLSLVIAIPEVINYWIEWLEPVPDKAQLLRLLWIIPLLSIFAAGVIALLTKQPGQE